MVGALAAFVGQADGFEQLECAFAGVPAGAPGEDHGDFDVLLGGEVGDQVAAGLLPDEADFLAAVVDEFFFGERQQVAAIDEGGAGAGHIEAGEDVEQR